MESHVQSRKHKLAAAQPPAPAEASSVSAATAQPQEGRQPVEEQRRKYAELQRRVEEEWQAEQARQEGMEVGPEEGELLPPSGEGGSPAGAMVTGEAGGEEEPVLALVDSLFDQHRAESLEANVAYMAQQHSLFLPNVEYLTDLEGLVRHLQLKVGNFFTCITCNKAFTGLEAVRNHMESKGHKRLDDSEEGQLEIGAFYDFSSTYPDDSELTDEQRDAELSLATVPQLGQLYRDGYELVGTRGSHRALLVLKFFFDAADACALRQVLPSGRRAGHREMARYYRQRFQPQDERDSVRIARIVSQYVQCGLGLGVKETDATGERGRVTVAQYRNGVLPGTGLWGEARMCFRARRCAGTSTLPCATRSGSIWTLGSRPTRCNTTTESRTLNKLERLERLERLEQEGRVFLAALFKQIDLYHSSPTLLSLSLSPFPQDHVVAGLGTAAAMANSRASRDSFTSRLRQWPPPRARSSER
jgi:hypothetical protein